MVMREPDKKSDQDLEKMDEKQGLKLAAADLLTAINSGNVDAVAEALKNAFEICDAYPHEEGEHVEPHSYEASLED